MHKKKYEFYAMSTFRFELKVIAKLERQTEKKRDALFSSTCSSWCNGFVSPVYYVRAYFLAYASMYRLLFLVFTIYHVLSAMPILVPHPKKTAPNYRTTAYRRKHKQRNL